MADLAELHHELGVLLGLTLATARIARKVTVLALQDSQPGLVKASQRLDSAAAQVQRRCQMLITRHGQLRAGRITATSRRIKIGIMNSCPDDATMIDLLELLQKVTNQAQFSALALRAQGTPGNGQVIAEHAAFIVSIHEDQFAAAMKTFSQLVRSSLQQNMCPAGDSGRNPAGMPACHELVSLRLPRCCELRPGQYEADDLTYE
jgi:hypothetical protein